VSFVLCYALASASWYSFESRILLLKSHFEFRTSPAEPEPAVVAASTGSIQP
jgi:hypothetical protein